MTWTVLLTLGLALTITVRQVHRWRRRRAVQAELLLFRRRYG